MTIMEPSVDSSKAGKPEDGGKSGEKDSARKESEKKEEGFFSDENLGKGAKMKTDVAAEKPLDLGSMNREISITSEDKVRFLDSIVNNARFTRDYSLFGGKVSLTVRSLTSDEVNALASWTVKQGTSDPTGLTSGRYRKFLAAAQVEKLNGVEMSPLEQPLFEHIGSDGKSVEPPGWTNRFEYWEGMSYGLFNAVMGCIADFDLVYSALCRKAEEANFWNPGTP